MNGAQVLRDEELTVKWSGNTGKARIQQALLEARSPLRVLDVGAVGMGPLDLWKEMPLDQLPLEVIAVDSDAKAVENARELGLPLELKAISGYELSQNFQHASFDLVICTQVLEHVARPVELLTEVAMILRRGGEIWLTVDSGHFSTSHAGDPVWKRLARPIAARVSERYYDFGMTEETLVHSLREAGFTVNELFHCNLGPLKPLYSQLEREQRNKFVLPWLRFEEELSYAAFDRRDLFRCIYASASIE